MVTGVRRGELCGLQIRDIDLDRALVHVAFNYVVLGGQRVRKDTKTHQDRWLAIDPDTCALIANYLNEIRTELAAVGVELRDDAYLFSNDPAHSRPWNPDWAIHKVAEAADAAGVKLDIKGGRHYTAHASTSIAARELPAQQGIGPRSKYPPPVPPACTRYPNERSKPALPPTSDGS
jgi:integrase